MVLFDLVLACANDSEYTEAAPKYLELMRKKYPDDELTLMAREAMGEKVNWALMRPVINPEPEEEIILPDKFVLRDNYPNPFNPMTTIEYDLPEESMVTLMVYDITGREVAKLVDRKAPAGCYKTVWDGKNRQGELVSSGVYLYRIHAGKFSRANLRLPPFFGQ